MIRKAHLDDINIVRDITISTIREIYPHYYPKGAVEFFISHHNDGNIENDIQNGIVYLLEENGICTGTVTLRENEICRLFVLPSYQGRGYGRELLDFAENTILRDHNEIVLDASLSAKKIYLNRGYRETEYHIIDTPDGDHLCYDVMRKGVL
ncbi:MAG: GNAT family N-acetyltransferase [Oscillospiraceae bacterium]|nr:GNAT family N-acetyltransferase [Oscillospiraceae bacterium]